MTASIQTKGNKYYIVLNWHDSANKRKQKWVSTDLNVDGNNKRKVEAKRIEVLTEYQSKIIEGNDIFFADFMLQWLEIIKNTVTPTTFYGYKQIINYAIYPYFINQRIKLYDLKPYHIQDFYNHKMEVDGISANTIHHYHANIHKALDYAVKMERIASNPSDKVDLPKKQKHIANYYTKEELQTLLDKSNGHLLETVIRLAAWFGLRRGEIIGVRWSSIDLKRGILSVTGTVKDRGAKGDKIGELYFAPTAKNSTSIRSFSLSDSMVEYFQKIKSQQNEHKAINKNYNHKWDDFVCVHDNGDLISLDYVSRAFPKLCKKCGLKPIKLHEMRHTNISLLLGAGATMKELQEWAGHSSYSTTANIYSHLLTKSKTKLTDMIEDICQG